MAGGADVAYDRSKVAFLTNIGHEIRTPLNGVLGVASLLKLTDLDPTQKRYVETIERSSEALMGVLSNLLEYAHLEAGAVSLESEPVQIEPIAAAALDTVRAAAKAKAIELSSELGEGAVSTRRGDRARIVQILSHLLNNAVKFTQGGRVELLIHRVGRDEDGLIRLTVADTGIGMSNVELQGVLKGVSSPVSSESSLRGAGLGLLIAQKLARQMGGRIVGNSQLGCGSRFSLEVPMGPNLSVRERDISVVSAELSRIKILAVEDDSDSGILLGAFLERSGADVTTVTDTRHILAAAESELFDIILIDLQLPLVDGIQATRAIRDLDGQAKHIPIVGVSTALSELDRWACRQSGMNDFVLKPLRQPEAIETLLRWSPAKVGALNLGRPA
jgi:CheY-like chemotaxis protein/anti-sigma regulatory factor (Ser/Thr protein kinase)